MLNLIVILSSFLAMFVLGWLSGYVRGLRRGWISDHRLYNSCHTAARCEVMSLREQVRVLR